MKLGVPANVIAGILQQEDPSGNPFATNNNQTGESFSFTHGYSYLSYLSSTEASANAAKTGIDRGVAQINSYWHSNVSNTQASNPGFAIPWATKYLKGLYDKYGSWPKAIAAYNAGGNLQAGVGYEDKVVANMNDFSGPKPRMSLHHNLNHKRKQAKTG